MPHFRRKSDEANVSDIKTPAGTPIVEPSPAGEETPDLTLRALNQRIRQQEILSEVGVLGASRGVTR
jgi:hypothetical protein